MTEQDARSLELRAVTSLVRLGKESEVRHMLGDVCDWFSEGFDPPDLREAKTLIDELDYSALAGFNC